MPVGVVMEAIITKKRKIRQTNPSKTRSVSLFESSGKNKHDSESKSAQV
jgi:hypothetical protein